MLNKVVEKYVIDSLYESTEQLARMEQYAKEHRIPIMDPIGIQCLKQLVNIHQPNRILEIGTAIGYSALQMAQVSNSIEITTIERDRARYEEALDYIKESGEAKRINVQFGDALDLLPQLQKNDELFDFVFIDAAKGSYTTFFEQSVAMLTDQGVIVSDNVLFRGYVAHVEDAPKRYKKLAEKIREYNEWLMNRKDFQTVILPIGDGIAVSVRKST
ncbi:MAG TPA: O-methyltransferase [Bacillota bacterium]|nr:O-methyltransferase [Bacillota bacterium]